jgi:hypothetical protein
MYALLMCCLKVLAIIHSTQCVSPRPDLYILHGRSPYACHAVRDLGEKVSDYC